MPKITETQRETRRQQILDAALRCFARDGFHNTTTTDIVRESGLSQGALYLYFATKDDIIAALADDRHQGESLLNALAQAEASPVDGLAMLIELYGRSLGDERRLDMRRVSVQGWAEALRNPAICANITANQTRVREAIVGLIQRGQRAGEVRTEVNAEAFARTLIAIFQGLTVQVSLGERVDLAAIGEVLHGLIRHSLLTPSRPLPDLS